MVFVIVESGPKNEQISKLPVPWKPSPLVCNGATKLLLRPDDVNE
jgi:hypothetical protein